MKFWKMPPLRMLGRKHVLRDNAVSRRYERRGNRQLQALEDGTASRPSADTSVPSPRNGKDKRFNDRAQTARRNDASTPH